MNVTFYCSFYFRHQYLSVLAAVVYNIRIQKRKFDLPNLGVHCP